MTCQYCGEESAEERVLCPRCRKRMQPQAPVVAAQPAAPASAQPPQTYARAQQPPPQAPLWAQVPGGAAPWTPGVPARSVAASSGVLSKLGIATVVSLIACIAIDIWQVAAEHHRSVLADAAIRSPQSIDLPALGRADDAVTHSAAFAVLAIFVTGVLFIIWLYRATRIVDEIAPHELRHRPGWAIGGWFVPFLNLVRPKQMVDDVWTSSSPGGPRRDRPAAFVHLWWATFLISGLVSRLVVLSNGNTLQDISHRDRLAMWGDGFDIVPAALAIALVLVLSRRVIAACAERQAMATAAT